MPISEAKKKANVKWDQANMTNLSIRVRRTYAEEVKKATAAAGTTPSAIMRKAIDDFMKDHQSEDEKTE